MEFRTLPFESPLWFPTIATTILVGCIVIAIGLSLSNRDHKILFAKYIGVFLFARFISLHAYEVGTGDWSIYNNIPLHLCGLSSILCILIMFKYNQKMFNFLALIGIPSAIHSIITPQWMNSYEGHDFRFYEFFVSHGAILFVPLFLMFVLGYRVSKNSALTVFAQCVIFSIFSGAVNFILNFDWSNFKYPVDAVGEFIHNANYLYLCEAPDNGNPLIMTNEWPYYIPLIMFIALLHILAFYYFFNTIKKVQND